MSQILDISISGVFLFGVIYFSVVFAAYWHDTFAHYPGLQQTVAKSSSTKPTEKIISNVEEPEIVREIRRCICSPSLQKIVQRYLGKSVNDATQAELITVWAKIENRWGDEFFTQVRQKTDQHYDD